ncbi:MAG: glycosyltransferase family 2 protein [Lachnospiraceae bacterium]|nr:glycosyltransferase family 2 protein [Lachnospiraceae bacterium]
MKTAVSVIIPNFNGKEYLEGCVASLLEQRFKPFEIIIVDDGSDDGAVEELKKKLPKDREYPGFRFITHEENLGFAKSVNDGIKASESEFVLLLNNDTKADREFVGRMYLAIRKYRDVFSVSAKMLSMSDPSVMDDCGDSYCALGWAYSRGKDKPAREFRQSGRVFAACGGAAIYRKQVFEEIGYFDEAHFCYLEDIDIGYRANLAGYRNIFFPGAKVLHAGSAVSGSRHNKFKVSLSSRNSIYLIYKNMPGWQIALNLPFFIIGFGAKAVFFTFKGLGFTYIKGLFEGFKMCREQGEASRVDFSKVKPLTLAKIEGALLLDTIRRLICVVSVIP